MCTTCGCGSGETRIEGHAHGENGEHEHVLADGTVVRHAHHEGHDGPQGHPQPHGHEHSNEQPHDHAHGHGHAHSHEHSHEHLHRHPHGHAHEAADGHRHVEGDRIDYGHGAARSHAPGMSQARMVQIERDILGRNDGYARGNRRYLDEHGIFALNLVSSPGSGKTTLLVETIRRLPERVINVIEGDQQTTHDAERIRATGARAIQVNTGKGCHLDASQVEHALAHLAPADDSLLFIENVGNLVCPAAFDLGEAHKVAVLSVTEGEDKPLKYPDMFAAASLMLLNKTDLLPYLDFDVARAVDYARRINPTIEVIQVSATRGDGFDAWLDWLRRGAEAARARRQDNVAALKRRIAELEVQVGRLDS
jgi:hydrogenase nickel incorporation protein HypB